MHTRRHIATTGVWRLLRGAVVGVCASATGALAHVLAGGSPPPPALLLVLALTVTAGCLLASRWRWSLPALTVVMLLAQLGFHRLFLEYGGYAHMRHSAHAMHADALHGGAQIVPWLSAPMAAGHGAAALGVALLLRYGEVWLRGVVDVLGSLLPLFVLSPWSPAPAPHTAVPCARAPLAGRRAATGGRSRAPPR